MKESKPTIATKVAVVVDIETKIDFSAIGTGTITNGMKGGKKIILLKYNSWKQIKLIAKER